MPRRARLAIAGIPWHIIQRGNNRSACFFSDDDYRHYLDRLSDLAEKYSCAVHAYVLMTNHVHLLLTPEKTDSASLLMKHLGQRYVQYINKTYRRSGTLWEGRFRSCLTQEDNYVLSCYRYIELNPVRAGMVKDPSEYPWSSYGANSLGKKNTLLTPHSLYLGMGRTENERFAAYRAMFKAHLEDKVIEDIRTATNGNFALGSDRFKQEVEQMLKRRARPGKSGRPKKQHKEGQQKSL